MMPINDLKFFSNEPERDLYSRFSKVLKTNTQFFDVLVGYFRTSGFFRLYSAMEDVERIRILVGLNVDHRTVEILDQADKLTIKEARELFSNSVESEFENSDTSAQVEQGVFKFIEWLKTGKLEMRMYVEAPLHAKVYIMRKDPSKADYFGSVITGSSNFSEAGLVNNLEFNVELRSSADVQFALAKFEELWKDSVPMGWYSYRVKLSFNVELPLKSSRINISLICCQIVYAFFLAILHDITIINLYNMGYYYFRRTKECRKLKDG